MRWTLRSLILLGLTCGLACTSEDPPPPQPETITLLIWNPDRILLPISARIPRFTADTGIRVKMRSVMSLGDIFAASQSPNHNVDVAIGLNLWVGDFVNNGFIDPLDSYIRRDMNDPKETQLSWGTIPDGVKNKNLWGGRVYSMICDNDNMMLIYRKDILSDPANAAAFELQFKYPLPNPPQTIDEVIDVATFFDGKDWDGDGVPERGFVISRTANDLMYFYALGLTTPYTVMPPEVAAAHVSAEFPAGLPRGLFMFKPDMTPLVSTPGFKLGISKWLRLARIASPTAGRQAAIDQIKNGEALMAVDWADVGPASLSPGAAARGKLGFALSPGTHSYFDWVTNQMVEVKDHVHYAPLQEANGFAFYMTSTSEHKEAVWKFIRFMNSPEISMSIVSDPRGGYQPWRTTHTDISKWVEAGWGQEDAANYVDAILKSVNHPNASLDLRIPGSGSYGAALEKHLVRLLELPTLEAGLANIDAEMEACAADLASVTQANNPEAQRAAYRAHLGLPQ
jgi:multiple sugar transport system substrate-binding protein